MERLLQDIRFATRRLLRRPLFTLIALVSLAVGIGANAAIFTLVNAVILRDPPVERPDELVNVYKTLEGFTHGTLSYPDVRDLDEQAGDVFAEVGGQRLAFVQVDAEDGVEMVGGALVTGNFFPMLGLRPAVGRNILPDDDVSPGGHYVAMLSHSYWETRYGADPEVVGRDIRLNGRAYRIVGVVSEGYSSEMRGLELDVFAPMMMVEHLNPAAPDELEARSNNSMFAKARLAPGETLAAAEGLAERMTRMFRDDYPDSWTASNELVLVPAADVILNPMIDQVMRPAAVMLLTVVGLVLLIACANLASFLLAQAADRRKEIALRLALGAPRRRLLRQLLTESLVLAAVGGGLGVLLSVWLLQGLLAADLPLPFPITFDLSVDGTVLLFSLAVTAAAGLLFGLLPALQATNPNVAPAIRNEGSADGRPARMTLRGALVGGQVAVSLVLLVGAGLFLRSLQARASVDPGFGGSDAGILSVQLPAEGYEGEASRVFFRRLVEEAGQVPGVTSAALMSDLHLGALNTMLMRVSVDGVEPPPGEDGWTIDWSPASSGVFETLGIRIVEGRELLPTDRADGQPVVVISAAMARQFWGSPADAVGRTFRAQGEELTVVGVAADAKVRSLGEVPRPFVYRSTEQSTGTFNTLIAATSGDGGPVARELMTLVRRMDPQIVVFENTTMSRHLSVMLLPHRMSALLVGLFGVIALTLACVGLYGAVSYAVSTRTREVGIRLSLGAERGEMVRLLMGGGLRMIAVGGAVGMVLAVVAAMLLRGLLYGVQPLDPVAFGLVPLVLAGVGVLSTWIPARRASRVSPVKALKSD